MSGHFKEELGPAGLDEDGIQPALYPAATNTVYGGNKEEAPAQPPREESWAVRLGISPRSFQRRQGEGGVAKLDRTMKPRHLQMIAIGGSIGAGFFVGSGSALRTGGPASVLIDFFITGIMIFNVVYALGELAVMYPVAGAFYTYTARFISPSFGFAMGWNYVLQWAVVLPLELVVCSFTVAYWNPDINHAAWITLFLGLVVVINIFGTLGYAEEEFWASLLKLAVTVVFMLICFVLVLGGGPKDGLYGEYWGARLWYDPGAFKNGFRGFCTVFVTAAFSFCGTELVGLGAAEARNPLTALPGAIKQVFWRITLFYILGLFFVGLLVRSDDPRLLGSGDFADVSASPFVLVGKNAGLRGFDGFMNAIILVSVLSIGVSAIYGGSRTLTALAERGYAPSAFTYVDRSGRPLPSVAALLACGLIAYVSLSAQGPVVFDWLLAVSGLSGLVTWGSVCLAHIRFRKAWAYRGHSVDEIPFRAVGGVYGSWLGLVICMLVLAAQTYTAICPVGGGFNNVEGFFKAYLCIPIVLISWVGGYLWQGGSWLLVSEIDVDEGRRELGRAEVDEYNEWKARIADMPPWRRVLCSAFF